jgi:hypothetical protein
MSNERLGIFEELQAKRAIYLPKPKLQPELEARPVAHTKQTVLEMARLAVDQAIKEAVQREIERRKYDIESACAPTGPSINTILDVVFQATGFTRQALAGNSRERALAWARALFWYIAAALRRDLSSPELGRCLGAKDHTSVLHAISRFHKTRLREPMATYCKHPAIEVFLRAADENPRRRNTDLGDA